MESRIVLITGSSSGIGEATAVLFASKGHRVVVHGSSSEEKVNKVVEICNNISPNNTKALGLVYDLNDADNADFLVNKTVEHFGGLDVLVNNAGALYQASVDNLDQAYEVYKKALTVNINSVVKLTLAAVKHLQQSNNDPNIVFNSSIATTKVVRGLFPYSMTKAAMNVFATTLAVELSPKVRSNIVNTGPVFTHIIPDAKISQRVREEGDKLTLLRRMGTPEDIAKGIYFLASRDASWMTGSSMLIDGGCILNDKPIVI